MELFYSPNACSLAPHIILRELGLPFDLIKVDLQQHLTELGEDFYRLNKKGQVRRLEAECALKRFFIKRYLKRQEKAI